MPSAPALSDQPPAMRKPQYVLPEGVAFTGNAAAFISLYLAAGAPVPLLVHYQQQWHFDAPVLAWAFAVYAAGFLGALLTVGSLSDHVGRRPVLLGALLIQLAALVAFLVADDIGVVIAARVVQGIATGAATSTFAAALVELAPAHRKKLGTILGSVGMAGGLAVGALLSGVAIEFVPRPGVLIFTVLAAITVLGIAVAAFTRDGGQRMPGALRSLLPQAAVPPAVRREFIAAAPAIAAAWMVGGLSLGLAPSIIRTVFQLDSGLLNGFSSFIGPAAAAVAGLALAGTAARKGLILGIVAAAAGMAGMLAGIAGGSLGVMIAGQVIGGLGFGAAFTAALRLIIPLAPAQERGGVVASLYIVAYLAFSVPVILVGQLAAPLGLVPALVAYGAATVLLCAVSLVNQLAPRSRAAA